MMFALLIYKHEYSSSKVEKKLYDKIFDSEYSVLKAARKLAHTEAEKLNNLSTAQGSAILKFTSVDSGFIIDGAEEFDAAVLFVDGKEGIYSENDATFHIVTSYKAVQLVPFDDSEEAVR